MEWEPADTRVIVGSRWWRWRFESIAAVVLIAIALRAWVNFSTKLPPSMDAAYYPTQARWLLEHGRLLYDDMPLYFWLCAGVARGLMGLGIEPDSALLLASRGLDSLLHPFAAVAIGLMVFELAIRQTNESARRPWPASLAAIAAMMAATVSLPAIRMTSDFQKNSLALVWMAGAIFAFWRATDGPRGRGWIGAAAVFLGLTAITHYGTAASTVMVLACIAACVLWLRGGLSTRRIAVGLGAGLVALVLLWSAVYASDAARAMRLVRAPLEVFNPFERKGFGPGEDNLPVFFATYVIGIATIRRVRRERRLGLQRDASQGVALGAAAGAMLLAWPLMSREYSMRLALMAPVPMAFALGYVLAARVRERRASWASWLAGALALGSAVLGLGFPHPVIDEDSVPELLSLRTLIADPERTLVVSTHGLEWWAGYFLHTPVRLSVVPEDAFERYERVLILQAKRPMMGPRRPGPQRPDDALGPRMRDRQSVDRGPRREPVEGSHGGPGGPLRIPEGTKTIHDGEHYTLYELRPVAR